MSPISRMFPDKGKGFFIKDTNPTKRPVSLWVKLESNNNKLKSKSCNILKNFTNLFSKLKIKGVIEIIIGITSRK